MTVSTTCIVNFCNVTVVLCKLRTFELATYVELKCSYTPIKPSFSKVTRCGSEILSTIHSLLARGIGGIVFALCESFGDEAAILTALLTL